MRRRIKRKRKVRGKGERDGRFVPKGGSESITTMQALVAYLRACAETERRKVSSIDRVEREPCVRWAMEQQTERGPAEHSGKRRQTLCCARRSVAGMVISNDKLT